MNQTIVYNAEKIVVSDNLETQTILDNGIQWHSIQCASSITEETAWLKNKFPDFQTLHDELESDFASPKFDYNGETAFISMRFWYRENKKTQEFSNKILLILHHREVYSLSHHKYNDPFDNILDRLKKHYQRYFELGPDHLFLALLDAVVDEYILVSEEFRNPLENLELHLSKKPGTNIMHSVLSVKSELFDFRRNTTPLKEELMRIKAEAPQMIGKSNNLFLRNIIDNLTLLHSNIDTIRELLRDITELHHANQNLQLNQTMKTLTAISAVFIPLTFIVGVYGMNFKYMPILEWRYGYLYIWVLMLGLSGLLVWYMRKKKWW